MGVISTSKNKTEVKLAMPTDDVYLCCIKEHYAYAFNDKVQNTLILQQSKGVVILLENI